MESLQILKTEETKVANYIKTGVSTISASDAVEGVAYSCNPCKKEYSILIGKAISKMFMLHSKPFTQNTILMYLESITETYRHETPETILLFLRKASAGDFGKFYGEPDIGTIREWFADFLQQSIIPERERLHQSNKEISKATPGQSAREYLEHGGEKPATEFIQRFIGSRK